MPSPAQLWTFPLLEAKPAAIFCNMPEPSVHTTPWWAWAGPWHGVPLWRAWRSFPEKPSLIAAPGLLLFSIVWTLSAGCQQQPGVLSAPWSTARLCILHSILRAELNLGWGEEHVPWSCHSTLGESRKHGKLLNLILYENKVPRRDRSVQFNRSTPIYIKLLLSKCKAQKVVIFLPE